MSWKNILWNIISVLEVVGRRINYLMAMLSPRLKKPGNDETVTKAVDDVQAGDLTPVFSFFAERDYLVLLVISGITNRIICND